MSHLCLYIGQIVWPRPSYSAFFGMMAAVITSIVESLGDYNACAQICDIPPPPRHAINRGIAIEGFGGLMSSLWGTGTGTASYSVNIVIIGITKVSEWFYGFACTCPAEYCIAVFFKIKVLKHNRSARSGHHLEKWLSTVLNVKFSKSLCLKSLRHDLLFPYLKCWK